PAPGLTNPGPQRPPGVLACPEVVGDPGGAPPRRLQGGNDPLDQRGLARPDGPTDADARGTHRNRYRRHRGTTAAGGHVRSAPSARTSNVCASTSILGIGLVRTMAALRRLRTFLIGSLRLSTPTRRATSASMASRLANVIPRCAGARPKDPHIRRCTIGSLLIWLALPSPIADHTISPLLMTSQGLMPNEARGHSTRSANLPGSIEPTCSAMPTAIAGLIVSLAT